MGVNALSSVMKEVPAVPCSNVGLQPFRITANHNKCPAVAEITQNPGLKQNARVQGD